MSASRWTGGSWRRAVWAGVALMAGVALDARAAAAQGTPVRTKPAPTRVDTVVRRDTIVRSLIPTRRDSVAQGLIGAMRDSTKRDSTKTDSAARDSAGRNGAKPLVEWRSDTDSIAQVLVNRAGFRVTRYQGDSVAYNAQRRIMRIVGAPGAVGRDQSLIVGDTVIYDDGTKRIVALGDTVILRDPGQQAADVVARGRVTYDIETRRASVTNVQTSVATGNTYYVSGRNATFVGDTSKGRRNIFYVENGIITSCDDSIPDYYFRSKEIKYVSPNLIVARPAVLYVADVPVFWIPFLFQDMRRERASGFLTPRFSLGDVVRNSSSYRRQVDNVGYYVNMGSFMDAYVAADWRSGARGTDIDPGFARFRSEFRYSWRERFLTGSIAAERLFQRNGGRAFTLSWAHMQDFARDNRLVANVNYTTNSIAQRQSLVDPRAVLATIRSDVRYSRKLGDFSLDVGGNRVQYPGRSQVDENYPSISLSGPAIAVSSWLDWTPSLSYTRNGARNTDGVGTFTYRYFTNADGEPDSARVKGSTNNQALAFNTPFSIKGFQFTLGLNAQSQENNFPITRTFVDPADTAQRVTRTYGRSYLDGVDWTFGFALPGFFNNTLRIRPDLAFQNVMGGSYWVRSELSGGRFVHQGKRLSGGVSMTPTLFALFPGFGPFSRIRHSITPTIRYGYAPAGKVNPAYLAALNQNPNGFLGAIAQNQISLTLAQVFEAKLRSDTSASGEGGKVKLLAINFSALTYDFERARKTKGTGFSTDQFGYDISSDLLPGVSFRADYSLFEGNLYSDTARFKPFLQTISAGATLNGESALVVALGRLLGIRSRGVGQTTQQPALLDSLPPGATSLPATGSYSRNTRLPEIPQNERWSTNLNFSLTRQRPPKGGGTVLTYDPATYCDQFAANPIIFDQCRANELVNPTTTVPYQDPIAGGAFVRVPPRETIQSTSTFHITQNWAASWSTMYDVVNKKFASHQVTLQRELHDWRAVFNVSSSPNGTFFFSFYIANKAQPELRLPYNKSSYRQPDVR